MDHERGNHDRSSDDPGRVAIRLLLPTVLSVVVAGALLNGAPAAQTFTGVITDDICAKGGHDAMQMGPTDAECTTACVGIHGATYVLLRGKTIYLLSDQKAPERFAGQKVTVKGVLDPKTNKIQVSSITASK